MTDGVNEIHVETTCSPSETCKFEVQDISSKTRSAEVGPRKREDESGELKSARLDGVRKCWPYRQ